MQVTKNIFQFSRLGGMGIWGANVFLLAGTTLTLVDTGFKGRSEDILKQVARLGFSPASITSIIVTHHHPDHTGSLAALKAMTGARVLAHPADAPYIDGRLPQPGPARPEWLGNALAPWQSLWSTMPVVVDEEINDGDELPILGRIQVLHTPGHTPGSVCLLLPEERMLIVGDLLSNSYGLGFPSRAFTVDMVQEIDSIKKIAHLDFDTICFGHGLALRSRARQRVIDFATRECSGS